ncbi:complex I NDUFA9 subunit family protein [Limibaculum sp. FT325]|uniref:complex I NDUFA9 subunit family protein n=1 Tax=Thermohalobaculum sediminis TaxID=2939436 RepID=UPI0020C06519|nr:complex I NDUFA9 subunit family protein [Limibaculum sediminis]MCL5776685.1 complex I NDUFA9 subunit family protein [Limibaculum sediminis]
MTEQAPLVTIVGGSGFIGRYIAQNMARRGWRVRVAVRRPNEAMFVKPYGVVGQVEPVQCNVRDDASMARVIAGADAVIYSVGVLFESGANRFAAVQAEGPARAARLAREAGVGRFVLISAIGADADSPSEYARTKAAGEAGVLAAFPEAVILRPSVVFGQEDGFFNRFAAMARLSPVVPIVGGATRFQPVWVQDVADAAAKAAAGEAAPGAYELGGPRIYTFRDLVSLTLRVIRRRRLILDLPFFIGRIQGKLLSILPNPPLTEDQVRLLESDNVVSPGARGFEALGIEPKAAEGIIETYLYACRPYGQYSRLTENREA